MGVVIRRPEISPYGRLAISLRTITGSSYIDVRWPFRIGRTAVYEILHDAVTAIDNPFWFETFPASNEGYAYREKFRMSRTFKNTLPFWLGANEGILLPI